jgi:ABC-2 type transport system permease protein
MATHSSTIARAHSGAANAGAREQLRPGILLPSLSLWWREIVRFYRMRSRVIGVIASPLLFWVVIGSGFGNSFRAQAAGGGQRYLEFFFPGALIMIVLFTSIFTMMSVIEDRREGFLLSVLVAPISRSVIVLGKVLGGATLATVQGFIFLAFAPFIGIHFTLARLAEAALSILLVSFALTALGFIVAWRLDSTQAFHAIINLFLMPLWMLSGSLFPVSGASHWIAVIMRANPLTYGVEALRASLYPAMGNGLGLSTAVCIGVLGGVSLVMFAIAFVMVNRRRATAIA